MSGHLQSCSTGTSILGFVHQISTCSYGATESGLLRGCSVCDMFYSRQRIGYHTLSQVTWMYSTSFRKEKVAKPSTSDWTLFHEFRILLFIIGSYREIVLFIPLITSFCSCSKNKREFLNGEQLQTHVLQVVTALSHVIAEISWPESTSGVRFTSLISQWDKRLQNEVKFSSATRSVNSELPVFTDSHRVSLSAIHGHCSTTGLDYREQISPIPSPTKCLSL